MKVVSITPVGKKPVYDISVKDAEHYILENGVVTHNTGIYYSANAIWIIGRSQEKGADGIDGYNFTINIEKSRYVKEKSKLVFQVLFDSGISKWSGLLNEALDSGHVIKPKNGRYQRVDENGEIEEKTYTEKATLNKAFWMPVLMNPAFQAFITNKYQLSTNMMYNADFYEEES